MKKLLSLIAVLVISAGAYAQIESHVKWSYGAKKLGPNEAVVFLRATIDEGWHIYSLNVKDGGPIKTSFTFSPAKNYTLVGKVTEPTPLKKFESTFSMDVGYFEKTVTFQQKVKLKSPGKTVINGRLEYMTCNDRKCLPPEDVAFSIPVGQ